MNQPNINPADLKPMICTECGGMYFRQVMSINKVSRFVTGADKDTVVPIQIFRQASMFKRLSALVSPTGKQQIVPIPVFRCDDCGHVPEEFRPVTPSK